MTSLEDIARPYGTILCDIWGVVHDGSRLLSGAADRLAGWAGEGKRIVLLTNAPRPASSVRLLLDELGLPRSSYHAIVSSGEAGIAALTDPPRPVGFLGTADDRHDLVSHGVVIVEDGYSELACAGLAEWGEELSDYEDRLQHWAGQDILFHCLNPDRVVIHCGVREVCPGALADRYEELGGNVRWFGKPYAAIYDQALKVAGDPPRERVLAIGDGLATDMLGAARAGIDAVFVTHGIHAGEPFPDDFATVNGLGAWRPLLTVADLS